MPTIFHICNWIDFFSPHIVYKWTLYENSWVTECSSIHSFIFTNHPILVRVLVDPKLIQGWVGGEKQPGRNTNPSLETMHTHLVAPTNMTLAGNQKTQHTWTTCKTAHGQLTQAYKRTGDLGAVRLQNFLQYHSAIQVKVFHSFLKIQSRVADR